jgi:hypothetical protein
MEVSRNELEQIARGVWKNPPSCVCPSIAEKLILLQDDHARLVNAYNRILFAYVHIASLVAEIHITDEYYDLFVNLLREMPNEISVIAEKKELHIPDDFQLFVDGQDPDRVDFHAEQLLEYFIKGENQK